MTLKNNRAPLLCYFKLCASLHHHRLIRNGIPVQKHSIRVKIDELFVPCGLVTWQMTSKHNRAHFQPTLTFVHHFVTIGEFKLDLQSRNAQFGSKSTIFLVVWPWNLTDDLEKQQSTSSMTHEALCIISSPCMNSNSSYGPETAKFGFWPSWSWPLTLILCMDITFVNGNHSWKFYDDRMTGTLSKRCDRQTDGGTHGLNHT